MYNRTLYCIHIQKYVQSSQEAATPTVFTVSVLVRSKWVLLAFVEEFLYWKDFSSTLAVMLSSLTLCNKIVSSFRASFVTGMRNTDDTCINESAIERYLRNKKPQELTNGF